MQPSIQLAKRTEKMTASMIREVLKAVSRPGVISLAGGIPAPESFPLDLWQELTDRVLTRYGSAALQYDPTEGFAPFREALSEYLGSNGIRAAADEILVTTGSQGVLDAVGKILISPGDTVAVESPTYLGALQAFAPYEPEYACLESDDGGLIPESLEGALRTRPVKFVYLVPTFQNPTGRTLSLERRKAVAGILEKYGALLLEDDPYSALRYKGRPVPTIKSLAPEHTIYASTLSKVFAPGLRIGFCAAPERVRRWLVTVKQGVDLHTSTYDQALAEQYLRGGYLDSHLDKIIALYAPRLEAMLGALERYFPKGFSWSEPEGGMFVWVEGPEGFDAEAAYRKALERGAAFVPGKYFFAKTGEGLSTMRLNFTMAENPQLERAVRVAGEVAVEMSLGVMKIVSPSADSISSLRRSCTAAEMWGS